MRGVRGWVQGGGGGGGGIRGGMLGMSMRGLED